MAKTEVLETPTKLGKQVDTVEAMDLLIKQKKSELNDMSNQYTAVHQNLVSTQNRIAFERADFNNLMAKEKTEFENKKNAKLSDLAHREEVLNRSEVDFANRLKTVSAKELEAEKISEERKQLFDLRVDTERIKNASEVELSKTLALQTEAQRKLDEVSIIKNLCDKKYKEIDNQLIILSAKEESIRQREEEMSKRLLNLEALKEEIAPKLEALKSLSDKNEATLKEIRNRELQLEAHKLDTDRIFDQAVAQSKVNKSKEIELNTREREVLRKEMIK